MRQIILDTETTGLDPALGHRVIEIGAVEIVDRRLTDRHFHTYINPERESDEAALQIHGLTRQFLGDKPKFADVAGHFLEFVSGAEVLMHNAAFDVAFLNYELALLKLGALGSCCANVVDTLKLAREMHPGKRNGLDTLCERYQIDRSARTLHGALLDAQLLARVYLSMTRGQESLIVEEDTLQITMTPVHINTASWSLSVLAATLEEAAAHEQYLVDLAKDAGGSCIWRPAETAAALVRAAA